MGSDPGPQLPPLISVRAGVTGRRLLTLGSRLGRKGGRFWVQCAVTAEVASTAAETTALVAFSSLLCARPVLRAYRSSLTTPQAWWEVTFTLQVFLREPVAPRPPSLGCGPGSLPRSLPSYLSSWAPWTPSRASAPRPSPASLPPDDSCDGSGSVSPCEIVTSPRGRPVLPGVRPRPPPQLRLPSCSYTVVPSPHTRH